MAESPISTFKSWGRAVAQNIVATMVVSLGTALFGLLAFALARMTPPLQSYAPLSYLFAVLLALLLLALVARAALSVWNRWGRRSQPSDASPELTENGVPVAVDRFLADAMDRLQKLEADVKRLEPLGRQVVEYQATHKTVIDDYQRMLGLEIRLDEAREEREKIQKTFNTIFLAFQAIRVMGPIKQLRATIITEGEFLTRRVNNGEPVKGDDWKEWQSHKTTYDSAMKHWMDHASGWHHRVGEWVNGAKPDDLTHPRWAGLDDLLEGSQAVIAYQTFALKHERWARCDSNIQAILDITAFKGPNASKMLVDIFGDAPTIEGVQEN